MVAARERDARGLATGVDSTSAGADLVSFGGVDWKDVASTRSGTSNIVVSTEKQNRKPGWHRERAKKEDASASVTPAQDTTAEGVSSPIGQILLERAQGPDMECNVELVSFGGDERKDALFIGKENIQNDNVCTTNHVVSLGGENKELVQLQKRATEEDISARVTPVQATAIKAVHTPAVSSANSQILLERAQVSHKEYDSMSFQYSNLFQWSPIKTLPRPMKLSERLQIGSKSLGTPSKTHRDVFPCDGNGAWSQNVMTTQNVPTYSSKRRTSTSPFAKKKLAKSNSDARKRPNFSPIASRALEDVSFTGVAFQGLPPEPNANAMCTPSKEQSDDMIQFSWHSRATIGSITGLPQIDLDSFFDDIGGDMIGSPIIDGGQDQKRSPTRPASTPKRRSSLPLFATPTGMPSISPIESQGRA